MQVEVLMPKMGESITEGKIVKWHKNAGEKIERDEILLEISTDKVDTEIPAVASGMISKIVVREQEIAQVGTVIAYIETEIERMAAGEDDGHLLHDAVTGGAEYSTEPAGSKSEVSGLKHNGRNGDRFYSPLVKNIAKTEGISTDELMKIGGSGAGGRVTKEDLRIYIENKSRKSDGGTRRSEIANMSFDAKRETTFPIDNMRQLIMEHMIKSRDASVHVAAITEVDMTIISNFISKRGEEFEKQEGFKLTFMPFIAHACVRALKDFPLVNSSIEGSNVVQHNYVNLGVAVAIETKGLLVPVIKAADEKSVLGLARAIRDLASRARNKRLTGEDTIGSTFSITNYGVFGNLMGTPIINQPNIAILGVGAVKKRPVVINDAIAIRQMGFLTLSFDHRLVDGALGGQFLEKIVQYLENFDTKQVF
ncbi:MAG TPA: dihydrolipoamide acetyltransferase family protein [Candidatus Acidoferrales bacterium]|nr:dihydrolipoamide acetyltransferase family protein [Candidatus Acidoferrales bacterium]